MDLTASVGVRLTSAELPGARAWLDDELTRHEKPDLHLAAGLIDYLTADFAAGLRHLEAAFLGFKDERRLRRAAIAATHLGRLYQDGVGNEPVASGWFARGHRLLDDEGDCIERGWAALGLTGCNIPDADLLERSAQLALRLARQFDDVDLECKALADYGLGLVGHGRIDEGMAHVDESMAMATSGECANAFITGQIRCCLVSACGRTGDLPRLEGWLSVLTATEPTLLGPGARPNLLLGHCQTQYGSLLCAAGRWAEAESALRRGADGSETLHFHQQAQSRAALAGLRIDQGRLAEAATLLAGYEQRWETQLPLVRLHVARSDHDLAVGVARQALRTFNGDQLRCTPILAVLVEAEIGRGNLDGAREAADALAQAAAATQRPPMLATARLAQAQVLLAATDIAGAVAQLEAGLTLLPDDDWPLLAAELHLQLAQAVADTDRALAVAEGRRALAVFSRVGAHRMHTAQTVLHQLGDAGATSAALPEALGRLTPREREILRLVAQGMSNPQIADRLVISPKTAEHHVGAILRKLQLGSRSEAAVYAATIGT